MDEIPYIKYGSFRSNEKTKPDIVEFKVKELDTFDTDFSTNVVVLQKSDKEWNEVILPLKSHDSVNESLLRLWRRGITDKLITPGKEFVLKTWLGLSKNQRPIRRFELVF
ncbi:hypothetical protein [Nitrosopumilus adriaticus]|uniref:Uncharacterized protein n=1 Tax=Nitrosopumilus adriaticus TaxID=1580092 RepID=A0A0D5C2W4_9ARCH|nr:hypothetical protein [Nitrosopumilus adriaticus]AJW71056.1 hypothetical protein NADRNF5_1370 [Nitrosopumilus adriaticus]